MKYNDEARISLFGFVSRISDEYSFLEVKSCFIVMKEYSNYKDYFDNIVKLIKSESKDWNTEMKYSRIRGNLAIVAGLYYGDDRSLKNLEQDYSIDLNREQLRHEVIKFTSHILFGKEGSGVDQVGDLQIEREGLLPIMDSILAREMTEQEQKSELMSCLRAYGILSERAMQEAREAANRDPDVILARNTYQNKNVEPLSFVEKIGSDSSKKVSFSV